MKRIAVLILALIIMLGAVPLSALPASAGVIGEMESGSFGKIFWVGKNPTGKTSGLSGYQINSNADADAALYAVNNNYAPDSSAGLGCVGYASGLAKGKKIYSPGATMNIVLDSDWTTSHFITANCPINIDLNGHTWTITGEEVMNTKDKNVSISGGTMVFTGAEWGPIRTTGNGNLTIRDVIFRDCKCDESGIVYFTGYDSKLYMENVVFENCYSSGWGACVYLDSPGSMGEKQRPQVIFKNCNFNGCHSNRGGGVLYSGLKQCDITFDNCFFCDNRSDNYCGGVIYANGDYDIYKFRNCAIYNCSVYDAGGFAFIGGTYNEFIGDPDFNTKSKDKYIMDTRTTVCGCYATGSGGAVYVSNTAGYGHHFKISGFNFVQNTAGSSSHTIKSIQSVNANEWGGALCLRGQYAEVERCDFIENYAHYYGGAVYLGDDHSSVQYCVFHANWSDPNYKGEDIFNDDYYNTITDNIYFSDREDTIYMYYDGTNKNNVHYEKKSFVMFAGISGSGTKSDPWLVTCSRAMLDLATNVSSGETYKGQYFLVLKDIPNVYVPIGSSQTPFMGYFDGGDHTFTAYMRTDANNVGIFGYCKSATIKNMHLKEGFISGASNVGGICAEANGTTFINCSNAATVTSKSSGKYVGGIAGMSHGTVRFEKCTNDGKIYGAMEGIGGIAGCLTFIDTGDAYKIIVTDLPVGVFDTCRNNGYVFASAGGGYIAGGIAGEFLGQISFKNCVNTGTVEVRDAYAGGIVGQIPAPYVCDTSYIIMNCMNDGKIIAGTSNVGGIVGWSSLRGGTRQILNCANYGEITAPKELGGILTTEYEMPPKDGCGDAFLIDVKNCYGYGGMPHNHNYGAIVAGNGLGNFVNCITNANRPATDGHSTVLSGSDADVKAVRQLNIYISQHKSETNGWAYWYINPITGYAEPDLLVTELGKYSGGGTKDNPYVIDKSSDLRYLEIELSQGKNVDGKYFLLKKDISFNGTPIGDGENPFGGIFDGGGHTITVTINGSNLTGLFGSVRNATIENLNVTGSVTGEDHTAGIAGEAVSSTIRNCSNSATIIGTHHSAGIVGGTWGTTVADCSNNGAVSVSGSNAAGIVGGIWGSVTVIRCCNNGSISAGEVAAGGIIGAVWDDCTVLNCVNMQNGTIQAGWYAAGIVGNLIDNNAYTPRIENCANLGKITANNTVGGIVCNGNPKTVILNCFSAGKIEAEDESSRAVIVQGSRVTYSDCFYLEGIGLDDAKATMVEKKKSGLSLVKTINKIIGQHPEKAAEWSNWGLDIASSLASPLGTGSDTSTLEGSGKKDDPYLIYSESDLNEISARLVEGCDTTDTYYFLMNDIPNYTGFPIGSEEYPFVGIFDGNSHTVNISDMYAAENVGFFGFVEGGKITNLSVTGTVTGIIQNVGAVVGKAKNAEINNCSSTAKVVGFEENDVFNVGGICGEAIENTKILNCYVSADVTGSGRNIGGIAGMISAGSVIRNCVKLQTVTGSDCVGGIVGTMEGENSAVENCANYGSVTGTGAMNPEVVSSESGGKFKNTYSIGGIAGKTTGGKLFLCFAAGATKTINANVVFADKSRGVFIGEAHDTDYTQLHYYKGDVSKGGIGTSTPAVGNDSYFSVTGQKKLNCQAILCNNANKVIGSLSGYSKWVVGGDEIEKLAMPTNYTVTSSVSDTASVFAENTPLILVVCAVVGAAGVTVAIVFARKKQKKDNK